MLIDEARRAGLVVHPQPFIAPMEEAIRAAAARANQLPRLIAALAYH